MAILEEIEKRNAELYEKARKELAGMKQPIREISRDPNYKPTTIYVGQEKAGNDNMAVFKVNWW